jgi:3-dehydroquinate synthase II
LSTKAIYIRPADQRVLDKAVEMGFKRFFSEPLEKRDGFVFMHFAKGSDMVVDGETIVLRRIEGGKDIEELKKLSQKGAKIVIVETTDWTVIPYENLIAELHLHGTQVYAVSSVAQLKLIFTIMEKGVDGVVLDVQNESDLEKLKNLGASFENPLLEEAEVLGLEQAGVGERVCVDTASILEEGEGLLVGNTSDFFFLVHNENIKTEYTEPRPFRVNAGAVHCYVLQKGNRTNYLSELKSGDRVLVVSRDSAREVVAGRAKIERRPLVLIRAKANDKTGSVLLQWAETIRLVTPDFRPVSVTELKPGSKILVHLEKEGGRHFGAKVDEFILEK